MRDSTTIFLPRATGGTTIMDYSSDGMRLRNVDFEILQVLTEGRNVAPNIDDRIDFKRTYINTRLSVLTDYGLVERVGIENSGLYELTERGRVVLELQDKYDEIKDDPDRTFVEFGDLVRGRLEERDEE